MKKIIHISDLHFGTERDGMVDLLIREINEAAPDIIIVSGDLTQRARTEQYQAARSFLNALNRQSILCVPGNHDISLYNPIARFFYPFAKYKKWIANDICTHLTQDNFSILGINSVTPFKPMGGYVTDDQLKLVKQFFESQPIDTIKIVVMHHNLIRSERHNIINDAQKIIDVFASCNVNLVLSGHIHSPHIEKLKSPFLAKDMYVITAGTPISTRTLYPNSFNVIEVSNEQCKVIIKNFVDGTFVKTKEEAFDL